MRAEFDAGGITFHQYPFPPASVCRRGRLELAEIRDADLTAWPPVVCTRAGETLFVSAEQRDELREWTSRVSLPLVQRVDVWGLLLEPFLDTEFTADDQQRTLTQLAAVGVPDEEVRTVRNKVERAMLSYNGALWDWQYLGLYDVLHATRGGFSWLAVSHVLSPKRFEEFYWMAMELAERGRGV